ncbi:putative transcription factor OFP family [Helianthus annuus]|nr:putative transcription factor OFP family [Helianthus annuus]
MDNNNNHNNHNNNNNNNSNRFKLKISKLFQSSLNSCRTKPVSDVVTEQQPFFFPENHHHRQLIELFSPKPQPFSSFLHKSKSHISRLNSNSNNNLFPAVTPAGKPPFHRKKPKKSKKKKPHHRKPIKLHDFSSVTDNYYYDCCSSDEDDEIDNEDEDQATLFSSRSFSSDSSVSYRKNRARRKKVKNSGGGGCKDMKATEVVPITGSCKMVKDSVAVVKKSNDPHEDFRVSMLEMIVERQILGVKDLEDLLECFLSLNSEEHHEVICEVFGEIWETLFSDWF